jgi:hypothetical protein
VAVELHIESAEFGGIHRLIPTLVDNPRDSDLNSLLETTKTRALCGVKGRSFESDPEASSGQEGVLFSVHADTPVE